MVKFLLSTLFAIVFAMNAAADPFDVKQTSDGFLNLRSGPGVQFDILQKMYPGDRVEVLEIKGTWARVKHEAGRMGWTSLKFLRARLTQDQMLTVKQTNDGYLNLRTGPGPNFDILRRLYPGDQVRLLNASGAWRQVELMNGVVGWAYGRYLAQ